MKEICIGPVYTAKDKQRAAEKLQTLWSDLFPEDNQKIAAQVSRHELLHALGVEEQHPVYLGISYERTDKGDLISSSGFMRTDHVPSLKEAWNIIKGPGLFEAGIEDWAMLSKIAIHKVLGGK